MLTLSDHYSDLLNTIWSNWRAASALNRLCDQLTPIVLDVMTGDYTIASLDFPVLYEDVAEPTTEEIVIVLAVAWIDALSTSEFRRGRNYLSDLDEDFLPIHADLSKLLIIGKFIGLDEYAVRAIFRKMREHRSNSLRLPREPLRVLKALDFFAKSGDELAIPDDLADALDESDCAFVWAYGEGYVMQMQDTTLCHIEKLTRTIVVVVGEPMSADMSVTRHRGWARERVDSFLLRGVLPSETRQSALDSFKEFLSQEHLSYVMPRVIGAAS